MKKSELRQLIREELENMGQTIATGHYIEALHNLKQELDINDPQEIAEFITALDEFKTMLESDYDNPVMGENMNNQPFKHNTLGEQDPLYLQGYGDGYVDGYADGEAGVEPAVEFS